MIKLKNFYSTINDGNMSTCPRYYSSDISSYEIRKEFDNRRILFGKNEGFDGLRIISSKATEDRNGSTTIINSDMLRSIRNLRIFDFYDLELEADILIMEDNVINTPIAYQVSDEPVVFLQDLKKSIVAVSKCDGIAIDKKIPSKMIDSMISKYATDLIDIAVYIGPYAHEKSCIYPYKPNFVQDDSVWDSCLRKENNLIHVDLAKAIIKQLTDKGIDKDSICTSIFDTVTSPILYSRISDDDRKLGKFYEGCYFVYEEEEKKKIK